MTKSASVFLFLVTSKDDFYNVVKFNSVHFNRMNAQYRKCYAFTFLHQDCIRTALYSQFNVMHSISWMNAQRVVDTSMEMRSDEPFYSPATWGFSTLLKPCVTSCKHVAHTPLTSMHLLSDS